MNCINAYNVACEVATTWMNSIAMQYTNCLSLSPAALFQVHYWKYCTKQEHMHINRSGEHLKKNNEIGPGVKYIYFNMVIAFWIRCTWIINHKICFSPYFKMEIIMTFFLRKDYCLKSGFELNTRNIEMNEMLQGSVPIFHHCASLLFKTVLQL